METKHCSWCVRYPADIRPLVLCFNILWYPKWNIKLNIVTAAHTFLCSCINFSGFLFTNKESPGSPVNTIIGQFTTLGNTCTVGIQHHQISISIRSPAMCIAVHIVEFSSVFLTVSITFPQSPQLQMVREWEQKHPRFLSTGNQASLHKKKRKMYLY